MLGEVGNGFKVAMAILNKRTIWNGRCIEWNDENADLRAADHANTRTQFGSKIRDFGLIKQKFCHHDDEMLCCGIHGVHAVE